MHVSRGSGTEERGRLVELLVDPGHACGGQGKGWRDMFRFKDYEVTGSDVGKADDAAAGCGVGGWEGGARELGGGVNCRGASHREEILVDFFYLDLGLKAVERALADGLA
jgi:hypothetical protein